MCENLKTASLNLKFSGFYKKVFSIFMKRVCRKAWAKLLFFWLLEKRQHSLECQICTLTHKSKPLHLRQKLISLDNTVYFQKLGQFYPRIFYDKNKTFCG